MTYSLNNPRALGPLIAMTVFAVLATVTVGVRLWSRKIRRAYIGLDDCMAILALVSHSQSKFSCRHYQLTRSSSLSTVLLGLPMQVWFLVMAFFFWSAFAHQN